MDKQKIDLNAPAFGQGAQKVSDLTEEPQAEVVAPVEEAAVESTEVQKEETPTEESAEEPERVKYSRYHKKELEAEAALKEAAEWRAKAEALESAKVEPPVDMDSAWVKLYGDSPESKEAWKVQQEREEALIARATERAKEDIRHERIEEAKHTQENEKQLDNHLELVSAAAGRDLTEKEETAVLDIIDDYTAKGDDGNYLGAMLAPDKAWEIYELKNQAHKASKAQGRDAVAALTASPTQGEPSVVAERDKNFNPLDWNGYLKRL